MSAEHHRTALHLIDRGDWDAAHRLIQAHDDPLSCLLHAWLHRQEGDTSNAGYWYRRAGQPFPDNSLDEELGRLRELAAH